jgi:hypothetical protein
MATKIKLFEPYPTINPVTIEDGVLKATFSLIREGSVVPNALISLAYNLSTRDVHVAVGTGDDSYLFRERFDGLSGAPPHHDALRRHDGTPIDPSTQRLKVAEFQATCRAAYDEFGSYIHDVVNVLGACKV